MGKSGLCCAVQRLIMGSLGEKSCAVVCANFYGVNFPPQPACITGCTVGERRACSVLLRWHGDSCTPES